MHGSSILKDVALCILGAATVGGLAALIQVPLILAYIVAGVLLGSQWGFGLITDAQDIETLSSIGLILLMFILGLEIHLGKLVRAGKAVAINGLTQFAGCFALVAIGFSIFGGTTGYDLLYLGFAGAMSSTLIVIKILSDRMEIDSLHSRVTIGILVIQDLWAITFLALQPNLSDPKAEFILSSIARSVLLVAFAWVAAKWVLPRILSRLAKNPEILLVCSLSWCFLMSGIASKLGLSSEMGALIAGVSIASFPYHIDLAARITSLRDFFITLFFVSLGLKLPIPTGKTLAISFGLLFLLTLSRYLTLVPVLRFLGYGNRVGILVATNLAQVSEFSLVFASLGFAYGHIQQETLSAIILALVVSVLLSSFLIPNSHNVYKTLQRLLDKVKIPERTHSEKSDMKPAVEDTWLFLGFYHDASSLLEQIRRTHPSEFIHRIRVLDFNPRTQHALESQGIECTFGDITHPDTLIQAGVRNSQLIICTLNDRQLKGATNLQLCRLLKTLAPNALIVLTSDSLEGAKVLYEAGADYVYVPRLIGTFYLVDTLDRISGGDSQKIRTEAQRYLSARSEILP